MTVVDGNERFAELSLIIVAAVRYLDVVNQPSRYRDLSHGMGN
jgi:hypothetical protein